MAPPSGGFAALRSAATHPGIYAGPIDLFCVFASDAELPGLARKVLDEKLVDRKAIKRLVKDWQGRLSAGVVAGASTLENHTGLNRLRKKVCVSFRAKRGISPGFLIEERFLASLGMIRRWVFENETEMGVGEWHRERF